MRLQSEHNAVLPRHPRASGSGRRLNPMSRRSALGALLCLSGSFGCRSSVQPINWTSSFALGMEAASAQNVDMVIFFHAPWCGICQRMKAHVFTDPAVIDAFLDRIPVAIDTDTWPHVAERYGVEAIPVILVTSPQGVVRGAVTGGLDPAQVVRFLEQTATQRESPAL